jgi:hypothetical protein
VNYFEMYDVEPPMWVRVATMHFTGPAKRWLQSVESLLSTTDWTKLCSMLHECFSRDQHELLLRQHFNIRQSSTVSDYVDKYQALIEQLKAYNPNPDLLSFTTRFIDGLRMIYALLSWLLTPQAWMLRILLLCYRKKQRSLHAAKITSVLTMLRTRKQRVAVTRCSCSAHLFDPKMTRPRPRSLLHLMISLPL